jgi:hypothetical protein
MTNLHTIRCGKLRYSASSLRIADNRPDIQSGWVTRAANMNMRECRTNLCVQQTHAKEKKINIGYICLYKDRCLKLSQVHKHTFRDVRGSNSLQTQKLLLPSNLDTGIYIYIYTYICIKCDKKIIPSTQKQLRSEAAGAFCACEKLQADIDDTY